MERNGAFAALETLFSNQGSRARRDPLVRDAQCIVVGDGTVLRRCEIGEQVWFEVLRGEERGVSVTRDDPLDARDKAALKNWLGI